MFGRVQIAGSAPAEALLVPDAAIGTEQVRKFVYVVGDDNVATPKYVTLGPARRTVCASSRRALRADDRVIVNGLMRVRPGAKVTPQQATAEAPAAKDTSGPNQLSRRSRDAHLALLHRPADLCRPSSRSCS